MYYPYAEHGSWWFSTPLAVGIGFFVILIVLWSLAWKGWALWKAARLGHRGWFIALLLINTAGILDILYIYIFSKSKPKKLEHNHDQTPMVVPPKDEATS